MKKNVDHRREHVRQSGGRVEGGGGGYTVQGGVQGEGGGHPSEVPGGGVSPVDRRPKMAEPGNKL